MINEKLKQEIRKEALYNAVKFNGQANSGAVFGKAISLYPKLKKNVPVLKAAVDEIIKEVNSLGLEKQKKELAKIAPDIFEERKDMHKKDHALPELKNAVDGKVVMRFAPSPSGPLHIGHAYVCSLNSEYCRKYHGKFIIRIEDTNSDNIYAAAYDMIPEDAKWVTKNNVAEVIVQSERMEIYYEHAKKLIKLGGMYICDCDSEEFKKLIIKKESCQCRDLSAEEHMKRWKRMLDTSEKGYKQGDAVARVKTDIAHKNPAMRDWPAIRINDTEHPRKGKKYRVWPLMNFAVAVDDHALGVTHAIRAKEHMDNEKRQQYLYDYFDWKMPVNLYVGRINFEGMPVSCTKTRMAIESGEYSGWEDIRIPFLKALKRRGYQPDALIKYALEVGVSQNDKKVGKEEFFKTLDAFNKDFIDPKSDRYFFVYNPIKIKVVGAPEQKIELDLHPEYKKGGRKFATKEDFYITRDDYEQMHNNKLYRLMDCINIRKEKNTFVFDSKEYEKFKEKGEKIIHWIPVSEDVVSVEALMPDNTIVRGYAELGLRNVKVDDIVQFERFGFVRCDSVERSKMHFWFGHR